MKSQDTRQKEMFGRVQQFGKTHLDVFPDSSNVGEVFAELDAAVAALTAHGDAQRKTAEEGRRKKAAARQKLRDRLKAISRTARKIAEQEPGFADRFKLPTPSRQPDDEVLSAGRVFAEEAEGSRDRFLKHGMRETFVADLNTLVQAFAQAIADNKAERLEQNAAQAGITSALAQALTIVRKLDVIVANQLMENTVVLAVWEEARHVGHTRRARRTANTSLPTGTAPAAVTAASSSPGALPESPATPAPAPAATGSESDPARVNELTRRIAS